MDLLQQSITPQSFKERDTDWAVAIPWTYDSPTAVDNWTRDLTVLWRNLAVHAKRWRPNQSNLQQIRHIFEQVIKGHNK